MFFSMAGYDFKGRLSVADVLGEILSTSDNEGGFVGRRQMSAIVCINP